MGTPEPQLLSTLVAYTKGCAARLGMLFYMLYKPLIKRR
jgi:hypothetical protein